MVLPDSDHDCSLLPFLKQLAERLEKVEHENALLKKQMFGRRSERLKLPLVKTGCSCPRKNEQLGVRDSGQAAVLI